MRNSFASETDSFSELCVKISRRNIMFAAVVIKILLKMTFARNQTLHLISNIKRYLDRFLFSLMNMQHNGVMWFWCNISQYRITTNHLPMLLWLRFKLCRTVFEFSSASEIFLAPTEVI